MAWNEPGGGRKPQDPWGNRSGGGKGGGTDLDDLVRQAGEKLRGVLGGGRTPRGGDGGALVGPVLAILALIWVLMGIYRFDQAEQGVVLRFGEYHDTAGPGLHWYPWIIDEVRRVNSGEIRKLPLQAQMITAEQNLVEIQLTVQYRVGDARAYLLRVGNAEEILRHATESTLRHVVGNSTLNQVISEGRANLAVGMRPRLQGYLDNYQTGLVISQVNIIEAQPPREVNEAFYDVIRAKEDKERLISEAQAYANGIVPEARGKAQRMLQEGEGYRQDVIARAEGDASRFESLYAEYRKAPRVTRDRLYLETMQHVYENTSKVVVDTDGNNMIYLPIEQVLGAKSASLRAEVAAAAAETGSPSGPAAQQPARASDRLRTRREETR
ncbi:MAG: FtsH protease activity modulator HflK [Gammaproteobacteria bacterium]